MGLSDIRVKLDEIDNQVLELFNERIKLVQRVAEYKSRNNESIYRPEREREIVDRLKRINNEKQGKLSDELIEALFSQIISTFRNYEKHELIAFLGPEASFTHQAAEKRFGLSGNYVPITTISGVFREVSRDKAAFGIVPIENTTNGIVSDTINCLNDYDLKIVGEVVLDVHHVFASTCSDVKKIKKIYSKDIAFNQCSNFLRDFGLDGVELIPVDSTAKAAQLAKEEDGAAAICAEVAAKIYDIPMLFRNIEDDDKNRTRFFVISKIEVEASGNDKTSILAKLPNKPGSLVDFLLDFKSHNIDLTKIKSHIVGGVSIFFLEFNGHKDDKEIADIFNSYRDSIKFLGSYVKEADDV